MATATVNGARLYYELSGTGEIPLVLVHGSWVSHQTWEQVLPRLPDSFRVLTYDRRGHSASERPAAQGSVREDVGDLSALIEHLDLAPAWIVGNSFGALITLRLAGERPDLFRGLVAHEPPAFSLLGDDPELAPMLVDFSRNAESVIELIRAGDHAAAAERFVDDVALGPGTWAQLPQAFRQTCIDNAPSFLDEAMDPEQVVFALDWVSGFARPALLTTGELSPPTFGPVVSRLAKGMPNSEVVSFSGAGHIPHETHPDRYVAVLEDFISKHVQG